MDPNATVEQLINAIEEQDSDKAKDALNDLMSWLKKGGYPPTLDRADLMFLFDQMRVWIDRVDELEARLD